MHAQCQAGTIGMPPLPQEGKQQLGRMQAIVPVTTLQPPGRTHKVV